VQDAHVVQGKGLDLLLRVRHQCLEYPRIVHEGSDDSQIGRRLGQIPGVAGLGEQPRGRVVVALCRQDGAEIVEQHRIVGSHLTGVLEIAARGVHCAPQVGNDGQVIEHACGPTLVQALPQTG